jgi:hypothetical protein
MNRFFFTVCFYSIIQIGTCQNFTRFFLDTAELQTANTILKEPGGNLWVGGTKLPLGENNLVAWLYRLDSSGNVIKRFKFPAIGSQTWVGMVEIPDRKIALIIGNRRTNGITENWMAVLDSNQILSYQQIVGADNAILDHCSTDSEGNVFSCGFIGTAGPAGNNFWIGKISPPGILRWVFDDDTSPNDHAAQTKLGPDNRLYVAGTVQNQGYNPYVACLDTSGFLVWDLAVATPWNDGGRALSFDSLGRIWMVGESSTSAGPLFDNELIIVDQNGQLVWQQWIGGPGQEAAFAIVKAKQNGFWVGGYSNASTGGSGPISPYLMRLNSAGESLGEAFWPQVAPSPVYDLIVNGDSVFYFCGISNDKAYVLKRRNPELSSVFVVSTLPSLRSSDLQTIWIDSNSGKIHFENSDLKSTTIILTDVQGRLIKKWKDEEPSLKNQAPGLYLIWGLGSNNEKSLLGKVILIE